MVEAATVRREGIGITILEVVVVAAAVEGTTTEGTTRMGEFVRLYH